MISDSCPVLSCPVCLSVCDVGVLWPNGWMDQHETCHAGRPPPSHIVLHGDPAPTKKGHSPQFSAHVRCGQTAGWIEMPLGMEVGLSPGNFFLDGDPAPPKRGHSPQIFGPCLSWPNRWIDQDATWYEGRPWPRRLCVRWGPISPHQKGGHSPPPNFWPMSIVTKRLDASG